MNGGTNALLRAEYHNSDESTQPMLIDFRWSTRDPYTVALLFHSDRDPQKKVKWVMGRELLHEAVWAEDPDILIGDGDVQFLPVGEDTVRLLLTSPSGHAEFDFDLDDLAEFVQRTRNIIEIGDEPEITDEQLWKLLDEEKAR